MFLYERKRKQKIRTIFCDLHAVTEDLMIFDTEGIPSFLYIIIIIITKIIITI
jgi:hypothetical protein